MTSHDEQQRAGWRTGAKPDAAIDHDRETSAEPIVETFQELGDAIGVEPDMAIVDPTFLEVLEQFRDANPVDVVFADDPGMPFAEEPPAAIGRFQIVRPLGQGGYGVVFLAIDPHLKRQVALKVPRPEVLVTSSLRQRFLREAEAAAALNHANVVPVFETGHIGPLCYIASAYCEGPNLEDWVQDQAAPVGYRQAAHWVQQLADAMQHAHSRGVWHRDLKPSNVLLAPRRQLNPSTNDRPRWTPQVADFGLARLAESAADQTRTGAILGTPGYMAPEQAAGLANSAGPQIDIYGLGAILYFLLTGTPPFSGDTPMATLQAVVAVDPPRPARLRKEIPRDLEAICLKCLEKEPDRRYASATALAADLQRFLQDDPIRARHVSSWERVTRWCRRNPALSALSALLVMSLLTGTLGMGGFWLRAEGERQLAERRASQLAEKTTQLRTAIDRLFAAVAESKEIRMVAAEPLRRRLLSEVQDYYEQFASQRPDDPALARDHAESIFRLAEINALLGDRSSAAELAEQALWELEQLGDATSEDAREHARYRAFVAHQRFRAGDFEASRDLYREALQTRKKLADADSVGKNDDRRDLACLWAELAASELYAADTQRAGEAAAKSMSIWQEPGVAPNAHADLQVILAYSQSLRTFGALSEMMGNFAESESHYLKAIRLLEPHVELDSIDALDLREQLYHCQLGLGIARAQQPPGGEQDPLEAASQAYEWSLNGFTQLTNEHPTVLRYREGLSNVRYSFAVTLMLRKKLEEAKQLLETNVRELKSLADEFPDDRTTFLDRCGKDLNLLCVACRRSQNPEKASEVIKDALWCFDTVLAERPDWMESKIAKAEALNNLGSVLHDLKDYQASLKQYFAARELLTPICRDVPDHSRAWRTFWHTFTNPVATYTGMKQYEQALDQLQAYLRQRGEGASDRDRLHEAWLLDQLQRYDDAIEALDGCVERYRGAPAMKAVATKASQLAERHQEAEGEKPPEAYLKRLHDIAKL